MISAAKSETVERAKKFVCNETLAYISFYRDRANTDALRRVVLNHFFAGDIGAAKKLLFREFHSKLTGDTLRTERRSSTSRAAHEAELDDILIIFHTLDVHNTLDGYLFVRMDLSALPKFGPEKINIATTADFQARMEDTVSKLSSHISASKPDSAGLNSV